MNLSELKAQVALGEDSRRQFKRDVTNAHALAANKVPFADCEDLASSIPSRVAEYFAASRPT